MAALLGAQGFFDTPAVIVDALGNSRSPDACEPRPFGKRVTNTVKRQNSIHSGVIGLLDATRPSAVSWRVVSIIIDAIKRMSQWTAAHIGEECWVAIQPSLANRDAASAIVVIRNIRRIVASALQFSPDAIFLRDGVMCSLAMNPSSGPGSQFFQSTTAGCSPAFSEPLSPYDFSASTVALAQPFGWHERVERHYSQTSKSLAFLKYGLRLWHGKAYHVEVSL